MKREILLQKWKSLKQSGIRFSTSFKSETVPPKQWKRQLSEFLRKTFVNAVQNVILNALLVKKIDGLMGKEGFMDDLTKHVMCNKALIMPVDEMMRRHREGIADEWGLIQEL